jgi:hypothetical protein
MSRQQKQQQPDADGIYVVRVHESLVQQLLSAPSEPVTVHMEFQPNGELVFVFTRHDCPRGKQ